MKEPKNLLEWLESKGNPKHSIAEGENGSKVIAVEDNNSLTPGVTLYTFTESKNAYGRTYFWISSGWGVRNEYLPALKGYLNQGVPA
jgi:hypothetical protein